jgi:hypothetical protein
MFIAACSPNAVLTQWILNSQQDLAIIEGQKQFLEQEEMDFRN